MTCSKAQIQHIDNYLNKRGIKYWDIRLEMIDHLVSNIEGFKGSVDFETAFKQSLINAGWDKNLKEVNTQSWKTTNKIYRKMHFDEIVNLLKTPKSLILFLVVYVLLKQLVVVFPEHLKEIALVVILTPLVVLVYESIKSWRNKLGKSVNMQYGFFYFAFGLQMVFLPLQLLPKTHKTIWLPILLTVYLLVEVAGYKVYKYAYNKMLKLKSVV